MDEESFHQEAQLNDPIVDDAGIVKMDLVQGMLDLVIGPRIRALALESEPPSSPPIEIQKKASLTESIEYSNEANILTSIVSHRQVSDTDVSNAVILGPLDAPDVEIEPSELEVEALDEGASDPTDEIQPQDADGNFSVTSGNLYEYDMKPTATLLPLISDVRNGGLMNFRVSLVTHYEKEFHVEIDSGSTLLWVRSVDDLDLIEPEQTDEMLPDEELQNEEEQTIESDGKEPDLDPEDQYHNAEMQSTATNTADCEENSQEINLTEEVQPTETYSDEASSNDNNNEAVCNELEREEEFFYDPNKSSRCYSWGNTEYTYTYLSDKIKCRLFSDRFHVGSLQNECQTFGAVPRAFLSTSLHDSHGILGLAIGEQDDLGTTTRGGSRPQKTIPVHDNLVMSLYNQGAIAEPVAALIGPGPLAISEKNGAMAERRGHLAIGWVRKEFHSKAMKPVWCERITSSPPHWTKKLPSPKRHWYIKLDEVKINDKIVCKDQVALVDTGTAYIVTSKQNFDTVKKEMAGVTVSKTNPSMFAYGGNGGFELSKFEFVIGGVSFWLNPEDYTIGLAPVEKMRTEKSQLATAQHIRDGMMISSIMMNTELAKDFWILGGIFLDNFVTIFDYGSKRVGFAHVPEGDVSRYFNQY